MKARGCQDNSALKMTRIMRSKAPPAWRSFAHTGHGSLEFALHLAAVLRDLLRGGSTWAGTCAVSTLLRSELTFASPLARGVHCALHIAVAEGEVWAWGHMSTLLVVVRGLVLRAIWRCGKNGVVSVQVITHQHQVAIVIAQSCGLLEGDMALPRMPHIFQRALRRMGANYRCQAASAGYLRETITLQRVA